MITVRIPDELRDRIDVVRPATVSREAWIRTALLMAVQASEAHGSLPAARKVT